MLYYILFIFLLLYIIKISKYIFVWQKSKNKINTNSDIFVSVIIPFRNEEKNLQQLISALNKQTYSNEKYEVIFVNDNSTDKSIEVINSLENKNFRLINSDKQGKKQALLQGINSSKGEFILTTDADCLPVNTWIESVVNFYLSNNYELISAPVKIIENSFFANLQAIEFFSLNISGGASVLSQKPILINAANMAFTKSKFFEFQNALETKYTSGDDIFLLLNFKQKYPEKIGFLKSNSALVKTYAQKNIKDLYNQRKRWISKTKIFSDFDILYTGIVNTLVNIALITLLILSTISFDYFFAFIFYFLTKTLVDTIFFHIANKIYNIKNIHILIPLLEIIYPIYILVMLFSVFDKKFTWKDRVYKPT